VRYIVQDDVAEHLPADWADRVRAATAFVDARVNAARAEAVSKSLSGDAAALLVAAARRKAINARAAVWRAASDALKAASHGKCWYCEAREMRSDMVVDHFRPKNAISERRSHPGYYWLAFEWRNFRLSCTFCNSRRVDPSGRTSGGKHHHFPVFEPPPHASTPAESIETERPELLDPVNDDDPKLLTFHPNGYPREAVQDRVAFEHRRARRSVQLYHLDHQPLVRARKRLAIEIDTHVREASTAFARADAHTFRHHKTEILKRVRSSAQFSSAARCFLRQFRAEPWVEELLSHHL
jgi:uncharacterized protein (TIGR02646 family)